MGDGWCTSEACFCVMRYAYPSHDNTLNLASASYRHLFKAGLTNNNVPDKGQRRTTT